jgi:sugar/nucleoside kinase (ribokinase family)
METRDLLLLGHIAKDEVVVRGVTRTRSGGAVYFGAFAARANHATCFVVTKLAPEDESVLAELSRAGIEVAAARGEHTTGIRNIYTTADQDRRRCELLFAGEPFRLEEIPDIRARILHVGALLRGQVPEELLPELAKRAPLGLDVQGFLRVQQGGELILEPWPEAERHLRSVTYLKADAAEAEVLTGETDLWRAAAALAALGPEEVVLTHADGVRVLAEGARFFARFDPRSLVGRTGRGDTCMCSYLAARAKGQPPSFAARYAAALTSMKLEEDRPFSGSLEAVLARMGPTA